MRPAARLVLRLIGFYRAAISPIRPPACRYSPSCSAYAEEAITRFGLARGSWLALRRLLRCHPFHAGGHDPVPASVGGSDVPGSDIAASDVAGSDVTASDLGSRRSPVAPQPVRPPAA